MALIYIFLQDMAAENYNIDRRLLDEYEALLGHKKDSRILDVAAGTGLVGVEVSLHIKLLEVWS